MDGILGNQLGTYKVLTPVYEGPLDLLLSLIERAELDITTVSLGSVTDQYLEHLRMVENQLPEEISSFLVIAAKLVQIKSEALLPRPPEREPGEEDPGLALVEQLRLYKRYKEIAVWMEERQTLNLRTFLRVAPPPKVEPKLDLSNLTLEKLISAAESALSKGKDKKPLTTVISAPKVTIREKIDYITKTLKNIQRMHFSGLITDKATRVEIVVTFLALLELVKRYRVTAKQDVLFGDIEFERSEDWKEDEEIDIEFE
ncbi:MAG: segregation/condensation protein A [Anaerolineales bacterium]|jgi:segregation and condensation protein A|uniref:segregation and condensation protein A n=1 Tax=Candidatus Villigracilis vicinus TaxID=3140679 RepID=UPI003135249F|nr:segregation/condensation protein A [Anaerolineales bacterium]MBK7451694.1 segregation/condensation protein A [Anaerolineales bacterium]MBK9781622.1 segregation/condensation protein A [Anaerolineales bacterium]